MGVPTKKHMWFVTRGIPACGVRSGSSVLYLYKKIWDFKFNPSLDKGPPFKKVLSWSRSNCCGILLKSMLVPKNNALKNSLLLPCLLNKVLGLLFFGCFPCNLGWIFMSHMGMHTPVLRPFWDMRGATSPVIKARRGLGLVECLDIRTYKANIQGGYKRIPNISSYYFN